jgi:hypothetical protein
MDLVRRCGEDAAIFVLDCFPGSPSSSQPEEGTARDERECSMDTILRFELALEASDGCAQGDPSRDDVCETTPFAVRIRSAVSNSCEY